MRCEWYFDPREMAKPDFNPSEAIEFWDLTNRQDWHVCELQQQGTKSRAYTAGRYSSMESSVHGFDLMVADRYANDGVVTPQGRVSKQESSAAIKERAKRVAQATPLPTDRVSGSGSLRVCRCGRRDTATQSPVASRCRSSRRCRCRRRAGRGDLRRGGVDVLHLSGDV